MLKNRLLTCTLFICFILFPIHTTPLKSMEFNNQEISDILLALASMAGKSIVPDETVSGKASFYFADSEFKDSFNSFLENYKLYSKEENNIIKVSRIYTNYDKAKKIISIKADSVSIESILKAISREIGITILYDTLPVSTISVSIDKLSVEEALKICIAKLDNFTLERDSSYFYVKKTDSKNDKPKKNKEKIIVKNNDLYNVNVERESLTNILQILFSEEKKEYAFFLQNDVQISNMHFENKPFETMLKLILEHGNADFVIKNDIYYILDLQKKGVGSKIRSTEIIKLKWMQAQDISSLLPGELSSSAQIKVDKGFNTVLITGTQEEINPIKNFLEKIDIPEGGNIHKKLDLKFLSAADVVSMIPAKMTQINPIQIPNTNSILLIGSKESVDSIEAFVSEIDVQKSSKPLKLKYIQSSDFLSLLPPYIKKEEIIDSGYPNLVFFTGSKDKYDLLQEELKYIDKPKPQIRYQILVIQYSKSNSFSFNPKLSGTYTHEENSSNSNIMSYIFKGDLSGALGLSFDVASTLGREFAAALDANIHDNNAKVFTDTTLTAISGQNVSFQNTDTYRYMQYEYDSSSSTTTRTGSTQTITSGLIVNLNGWISGDNMITMTVNATVSKQNSSSSSSNTSITTLPSTSERVVNTQVRTQSGEPVIISGLIKESDDDSSNRTPFLSRIPLLGRLFKNTSNSKDKTEIVIYIVPHLVSDEEINNDDSINIERFYNNLIGCL